MRRPQLFITGAAVAAAIALAGCSSASHPSSPASSIGSSPASAASSTSSVAPITGRMTPAPWDRPVDQATQVTKAGLALSSTETLTVHYHVHLDVIVDGKPATVPAGLGINGFDAQLRPMKNVNPGIAPLHTHNTSGVLHIEAPAAATFTLGQAFTEWNVALAPGQVGGYTTGDAAGDQVSVFVNGEKVGGDPRSIVLKAHEEIAVIVSKGTEKVTVPSTYQFPTGM